MRRDARRGFRSTAHSLRAAWLVSDPAAVEELRLQVKQLTRQRLMHTLDVGPEQLDELVGDDAEALAELQELVDQLELKLRPDRVRAVVRRSATAFGGRSMLDAIRDGELRQVLATVRESFRWEEPA
jgi:hypothetical protein